MVLAPISARLSTRFKAPESAPGEPELPEHVHRLQSAQLGSSEVETRKARSQSAIAIAGAIEHRWQIEKHPVIELAGIIVSMLMREDQSGQRRCGLCRQNINPPWFTASEFQRA
jgi:hypothetical protein